jgi:hypothetical protein
MLHAHSSGICIRRSIHKSVHTWGSHGGEATISITIIPHYLY